jgi:hypothetical protein
MRFLCVAFFCAVALCSCADPSKSPFDPQAAAFIHDHGEGVIEGHAFTINQMGFTINAAGQRVYLVPATPYARERFAAVYLHGHNMPVWLPDLYGFDPRYISYIRTTIADAGGVFRFDLVAPGTYIVFTQVSWQIENRLLPEGRQMFETVMITGNETKPVRVIIAGN